MRLEVIDTSGNLERLSAAWDALCEAAGAPVLTRPFWCIPWANHLNGWRPHVITVFDGDELVALAPFQLRNVGGVELVRFLGHGVGTVSSVVTRPGCHAAAHTIWEDALCTRRTRRRFAQLLCYRDPRVEDPSVTDPAVAGLAGYRIRSMAEDSCLVVDCASTFESYFATRPKKLRENIRRAERAMAADDGFVVEVITTEQRWREVRSEVLAIYDEAERARPRQHFLRGPLTPFTEELLARAAADGVLRLFVGRIQGLAASFGIAFAAGSTLSYWVSRFHPDRAARSVGVLLQRDVIARGFAEGADRVDLLLGDQAHKRRWSTSSYATLTVLAARSQLMLTLGRTTLTTIASYRRYSTARRPT